MPQFEIPCTWIMSGRYYIEADNLREAIKRVQGDMPLPDEREYVSCSLEVDDIDEVFGANKMEVPDLGIRTDEIEEELDKRTDPRVKARSVFNAKTADYSIDDLVFILRDYYGIEYSL